MNRLMKKNLWKGYNDMEVCMHRKVMEHSDGHCKDSDKEYPLFRKNVVLIKKSVYTIVMKYIN